MKPLQYWTPNGFEISSFQFKLDERKGKIHRTSGSDNTGKCFYTYNELGFRGDSIHKDGFKVMSLGCSNTEGVGVCDTETWPHQFTSLIPNGVDMNFGTGGRSNDFICRCLLTYFDLIKPDLVLVMYTGPQRREVYTKNGGIEPYMITHSWGFLNETDEGKQIQENLSQLQNDNQDFINWYKNHLIIKYFLESKKCNWVWNGSFQIPKEYIDDTIRFDGDYGDFIDKAVDNGHPGPQHNKLYAHKLHKFIFEKHPNYIDYLPKKIQNLI